MSGSDVSAGRFCWLDLAATDADRAKTFYRQLFGWISGEQSANGGSFTHLRLADKDVGSIYQLQKKQIEHGVPSHWTPYVRVSDADSTAQRAALFGGKVLVRPFDVSGVARIALISDAVGAVVGLWESIETKIGE